MADVEPSAQIGDAGLDPELVRHDVMAVITSTATGCAMPQRATVGHLLIHTPFGGLQPRTAMRQIVAGEYPHPRSSAAALSGAGGDYRWFHGSVDRGPVPIHGTPPRRHDRTRR